MSPCHHINLSNLTTWTPLNPKHPSFLHSLKNKRLAPQKWWLEDDLFLLKGSLIQGYVLQLFGATVPYNKALLNPFFLVGEYLSSFLPDVGCIAHQFLVATRPPLGPKAPLLRFKSQLCARYTADDVLQVLDTDPVPWQENSKRVVLRFHGSTRLSDGWIGGSHQLMEETCTEWNYIHIPISTAYVYIIQVYIISLTSPKSCEQSFDGPADMESNREKYISRVSQNAGSCKENTVF